jgi:hypothetical protein
MYVSSAGARVRACHGAYQAPLRYFDDIARRPGLPPHIAALVTGVEKEELRLSLVNLGPLPEDHARLVVQVGTAVLHNLIVATVDACS